MLFCPAAPPLSRRTLNLTARTIRAHRQNTRSRWRRLDPAAGPAPAGSPTQGRAVRPGRGRGRGGRHDRLAHACARPRPCSHSRRPPRNWGCAAHAGKGGPTSSWTPALIACDRVAADRPFYSDKHQRHGMNIQVVAAPDGEPLWTSWSLLGSVHDARAARVWRIAERVKASGLLGLGDKGYVGLSQVVFCPFKGRGKPRWKKDADSEHAKLRSPGGRAIAQLKNWDVLRRLRCCPHRTGRITRAELVLRLREAR